MCWTFSWHFSCSNRAVNVTVKDHVLFQKKVKYWSLYPALCQRQDTVAVCVMFIDVSSVFQPLSCKVLGSRKVGHPTSRGKLTIGQSASGSLTTVACILNLQQANSVILTWGVSKVVVAGHDSWRVYKKVKPLWVSQSTRVNWHCPMTLTRWGSGPYLPYVSHLWWSLFTILHGLFCRVHHLSTDCAFIVMFHIRQHCYLLFRFFLNATKPKEFPSVSFLTMWNISMDHIYGNLYGVFMIQLM